jgi:hypothetical protein
MIVSVNMKLDFCENFKPTNYANNLQYIRKTN